MFIFRKPILLHASAKELPLSVQNDTTGICQSIDMFKGIALGCGSTEQKSQGGSPHSAAQEPAGL